MEFARASHDGKTPGDLYACAETIFNGFKKPEQVDEKELSLLFQPFHKYADYVSGKDPRVLESQVDHHLLYLAYCLRGFEAARTPGCWYFNPYIKKWNKQCNRLWPNPALSKKVSTEVESIAAYCGSVNCVVCKRLVPLVRNKIG